ncbi:hypothetical protein [Lichenicola cladoniae]|uniref:hypothetical protein n=1 Tax=Lichenicola cladoniae TaxID=1484109 RepID=UPI001EF624D9|nr:hypothetical protein [Lichenicola cladoniae]
MSPRHIRWRQTGLQTFGNDLALLLRRPIPPALSADDDLHGSAARALTVNRMSGFSIGERGRQHRIHAALPTYSATPEPCAGPATLTWQTQHRYMQTEPMADIMAPTINVEPAQIATVAA